MSNQKAIEIRRKKLAVLLMDARMAAGRTKNECAEALGITGAAYGAYENGRRSPSLPELEVLAFVLDVPLSHFWGSTSLSENGGSGEQVTKLQKVLALRQRIVGAQVRQAREAAEMSVTELTRRTGISSARLKKYETGDKAIPLPELESIAHALGRALSEFQDTHGPVGDWLREQTAIQQLLEMPAELQDFVCRPYNRPYLEIAQRLSNMDVNRLRAVAEGLLDITL
jgi:transcriptional regulator with XRE-family HTH domain